MNPRFQVKILSEAKEFILDLEEKSQRKVAFVIQKSRLVDDPKILKKIIDNLWEYRIRANKQHIRLFAFWDPGIQSLIVCTHGFIKKTNKLPKKVG